MAERGRSSFRDGPTRISSRREAIRERRRWSTCRICRRPGRAARRSPGTIEASAPGGRGFAVWFAVPMFRDSQVVGAIAMYRSEPGRFADKRDRSAADLRRARRRSPSRTRGCSTRRGRRSSSRPRRPKSCSVISGSPTDVKPVFESIVKAAKKLSGASASVGLPLRGWTATLPVQRSAATTSTTSDTVHDVCPRRRRVDRSPVGPSSSAALSASRT